MQNYLTNIEEKTVSNSFFRQVLFTSQHVQVVVMSLMPNEDIGEEVHEIVDQFLRIEQGEGKVVMDDVEHNIKAGDAIVVPAGARHNIINTSTENPLKLYTVYAPPHHKDGTIHETKKEAQADTADHL